jgi:hypothetical protein
MSSTTGWSPPDSANRPQIEQRRAQRAFRLPAYIGAIELRPYAAGRYGDVEERRHLIDAAMTAYVDSGIPATVSINLPNVVEYEKYPFLLDLLPDMVRKKMREGPALPGEVGKHADLILLDLNTRLSLR